MLSIWFTDSMLPVKVKRHAIHELLDITKSLLNRNSGYTGKEDITTSSQARLSKADRL